MIELQRGKRTSRAKAGIGKELLVFPVFEFPITGNPIGTGQGGGNRGLTLKDDRDVMWVAAPM